MMNPRSVQSTEHHTYKDAVSNNITSNGRNVGIVPTSGITYGSRPDESNLAADVDIVVFGVDMNVSRDDVANYAMRYGIKVMKCELLTKWENARSNTFKLTINPKHVERALSSSIWPDGVGVRRFKTRILSTRNDGNDGKLKRNSDGNRRNWNSRQSIDNQNRYHQLNDQRDDYFV